jgi:rod shape-determining protein MreD
VARVLTYGALVATALILQLSVLDVLPLPGGIAPDLVLLVVVAIALTSGPLPGLVTGFSAGLALDLAPPASHAIGAYALVFCLVGYLCGRAAGAIDRSAFLPLAAMALGVVGGSVLYAVVGVTFGEPGVTSAAARNVLPLSVGYGLLLSPFVLYLVLRLTQWAGQAADDPAAALARLGSPGIASGMRRGGARDQPREPRLRPGTGPTAGRIGAGAPADLLTASGRPSGGLGGGAGSAAGPGGRQSPLPRLRFGLSKPQGVTGAARPPRTARLRFGPSRLPARIAGEKPGVFAGGSLNGGSPVRLRLGTGRTSRLRSRLARALGRRHGRQTAGPRFTARRSGTGLSGTGLSGTGRSATGLSGTGRSGARSSGTGRSGLVRFRRSGRVSGRRFGSRYFGSKRSGSAWSSGQRSGWVRSSGQRSGWVRSSGQRSGWMRSSGRRSRWRSSGPRAGWLRAGGAVAGLRRGWLSDLRPRGGWPAMWRTGRRRTGGIR